MSYVAWLRGLAERMSRHRPQPPLTRLEYCRALARRMSAWAPQPAAVLATDSALDGFRRLVMARPQRLRFRLLGANVDRLRSLPPSEREALRVLEIEPDLLSPMGRHRSETVYASVLAHHLDPAEAPGIAPAFLRVFLRSIGCDEALFTDDLDDVEVRTERFVAGGRVDISIETSRLTVFVELKVEAAEGHDQLGRYRKALARQISEGGREGRLVYLTLRDAVLPSVPVDAHLTWDDILTMGLPLASTTGGAGSYFGRFLKSVAILVERADRGTFADWSFYIQRRALDLIEGGAR